MGGHTETAPAIRVVAPAKINVGLRILGQRSDGYHEIWTILQQINLADEIVLQSAPDFSLSLRCDDPRVPVGGQNLCLRAAHLLREETGCAEGALIDLKKLIPVGAGLGGGSSDAAAALRGLNQLWNTALDDHSLQKLAAKLGSDIPFFVQGGCCIATGRGELLQGIKKVVNDPIVLVCPDVEISTEWAYKNIKKYNLTSERESIIFQDSFVENLSDPAIKRLLTNDFESLVFDHYPSLLALKESLLDCGAYFSSLSGSGSSLYGVFSTIDDARKASKKLRSGARIYLLEP